MKLSARTIQLLKNFASVNQSILIRSGKVLSVMSPSKTVFARAEVEESFPQEFAIYDLSKFLSALSLFNDPDFKFKSGAVIISEGGQSVKYVGADPSFIVAPPSQDIAAPDALVEFEMPSDALLSVTKAMNALQLPELAIKGDGSKITLSAVNEKNPAADQYDAVVGSTKKIFNIIFKAENIKLISDNYKVSVSERMGVFKALDVCYFIACESNSTFEE